MRKIRFWTGIILSLIFIFLCLTPQVRNLLVLPPTQKLVVGEASFVDVDLPAPWQEKIEMKVMGPARSVFAPQADPPVTVARVDSGYEIMALRPGQVRVRLNLFGYIPLKSIKIEALPTKRVVLGGHSIGVVMQSNGIMVVGFAPVADQSGAKHYPGREQGIEIGDLILAVDNNTVSTETDLARIIDNKKVHRGQ